MTQPNILLLMTDQQRWDAMGCSGGWVNTPHVDRIASEGVRFSNCVTNSPVCVPARLSLATGRYPHNTGVWRNAPHTLAADAPTWMQAIRDAGYRTSLFGKTHLHPHRGDLRDRLPLMHAYGLDDVDEIGGPRASAWLGSTMTDQWQQADLLQAYRADYAERFANKPHVVRSSVLPLEQYADVYVGQSAKRYLKKYDRDQPWFCWVSFGGPHEPWDTPEPYASMYDPADMPAPCPRMECRDDDVSGRLNQSYEHAPELTAEDIAAMRADYAGSVTLIDDQIGEILATVEQRGELQNTVIAFVSDHGELNGDHGMIYKEVFLDGAVRVPLLLRTPQTVREGASRVSDTPVEWFDLGPTLVELAGGKLHHRQFARSLCPHLQTGGEHRTFAISEVHGEIMYLDRKWKLLLNQQGQPYCLFDREADPLEINNLVQNARLDDVITEVRLRIQEFLVQSQDQFGE